MKALMILKALEDNYNELLKEWEVHQNGHLMIAIVLILNNSK